MKIIYIDREYMGNYKVLLERTDDFSKWTRNWMPNKAYKLSLIKDSIRIFEFTCYCGKYADISDRDDVLDVVIKYMNKIIEYLRGNNRCSGRELKFLKNETERLINGCFMTKANLKQYFTDFIEKYNEHLYLN